MSEVLWVAGPVRQMPKVLAPGSPSQDTYVDIRQTIRNVPPPGGTDCGVPAVAGGQTNRGAAGADAGVRAYGPRVSGGTEETAAPRLSPGVTLVHILVR